MPVSAARYRYSFYETLRILHFCLLLGNWKILWRNLLEMTMVYVNVTNDGKLCVVVSLSCRYNVLL